MDSNKILCTVTEVKIIDESIPVDNDNIMSIISKMEFDGKKQPIFIDKLNTTSCDS